MPKVSNHPMNVKLEPEGKNGASFSLLSNVMGSSNKPSHIKAEVKSWSAAARSSTSVAPAGP